MRAIVTGRAGFIGSAVCRHLIGDLGHEVINFDKPTYAACLASLDPVVNDDRSGVYHFANPEEATWFGVARQIFSQTALVCGPVATVEPVGTADFPTPARRPVNSRLATTGFKSDFRVTAHASEDTLHPIGRAHGDEHAP